MIVHDYSIKQQEQVQELYVLMTITSKNSAVCYIRGLNLIHLDFKYDKSFLKMSHLLFFCLLAALFDPILILFPPVFPVGAKYIIQCETQQTDYINTTLNMYDRLLPISPGKESFKYVGSRDLAPGEWGASITRKNAGETYEFICEMEVFFNGRTLRSRSKLITAMPGTNTAPNHTVHQYNSLT